MRIWNLNAAAVVLLLSGSATAQHDHMTPAKEAGTAPAKPGLKPAQGAAVKITSPKAGQIVKGDAVPLEFKLIKGKVGEHVHAYIDGEMAGMFKGGKGTLNGVKPGQHVLELRVTTADHNTELDATDKVSFTTTQ